ncbi:MAG: chorismate lyase [Ketobacter sp.]|nr:MAG: chorismate lyase [Ketobacter sp.]
MTSQHFLPAILHDQTLYQGGGGRVPPYQIPRSYRDWLLDPDSLTQRLIRESGGEFRVELLRQGHLSTTAQERDALALGLRTWPFLREVTLRCHDQPWVFARTVIPTATLMGPARALTHLGTKPLGAVLFNHPHVRRGPISVYRLNASRLSTVFAHQGLLWGRQSLFYLYDKPLLVSEYFLQRCPMYLLDQRKG